MATIRNVGSQGEPVGPWEGLEAVIGAIDSAEDPGAQMRACFVWISSCVKSLTADEISQALKFASDEWASQKH